MVDIAEVAMELANISKKIDTVLRTQCEDPSDEEHSRSTVLLEKLIECKNGLYRKLQDETYMEVSKSDSTCNSRIARRYGRTESAIEIIREKTERIKNSSPEIADQLALEYGISVDTIHKIQKEVDMIELAEIVRDLVAVGQELEELEDNRVSTYLYKKSENNSWNYEMKIGELIRKRDRLTLARNDAIYMEILDNEHISDSYIAERYGVSELMSSDIKKRIANMAEDNETDPHELAIEHRISVPMVCAIRGDRRCDIALTIDRITKEIEALLPQIDALEREKARLKRKRTKLIYMDIANDDTTTDDDLAEKYSVNSAFISAVRTWVHRIIEADKSIPSSRLASEYRIDVETVESIRGSRADES